MWQLWPLGSARLLQWRRQTRALEMLATSPLPRLPLSHHQPGVAARVPRAAVLLLTLLLTLKEEDDTQQNTLRSRGWGRNTNKKELLYNPQIIPSQLMLQGQGREGGEKQQLGFWRTMWGEKRKREEDECG